MSKNVGSVDRGVRVFLGLAAIVAGLALKATVGTLGLGILIAVGVILVSTALIGWCPLYRMFGLSTCSLPKAKP